MLSAGVEFHEQVDRAVPKVEITCAEELAALFAEDKIYNREDLQRQSTPPKSSASYVERGTIGFGCTFPVRAGYRIVFYPKRMGWHRTSANRFANWLPLRDSRSRYHNIP